MSYREIDIDGLLIGRGSEVVKLREEVTRLKGELEDSNHWRNRHSSDAIAHAEQAHRNWEEVERLRGERDDAIKEANRRDQKWMDGIDDIVGIKLDYGDPCSRDNASRALENMVNRYKSALEKARVALDSLFEAQEEDRWSKAKLTIETINKVLGETK